MTIDGGSSDRKQNNNKKKKKREAAEKKKRHLCFLIRSEYCVFSPGSLSHLERASTEKQSTQMPKKHILVKTKRGEVQQRKWVSTKSWLSTRKLIGEYKSEKG